jgi:hypothetical protein
MALLFCHQVLSLWRPTVIKYNKMNKITKI